MPMKVTVSASIEFTEPADGDMPNHKIASVMSENQSPNMQFDSVTAGGLICSVAKLFGQNHINSLRSLLYAIDLLGDECVDGREFDPYWEEAVKFAVEMNRRIILEQSKNASPPPA